MLIKGKLLLTMEVASDIGKVLRVGVPSGRGKRNLQSSNATAEKTGADNRQFHSYFVRQ